MLVHPLQEVQLVLRAFEHQPFRQPACLQGVPPSWEQGRVWAC